jgi:hypothetical protein
MERRRVVGFEMADESSPRHRSADALVCGRSNFPADSGRPTDSSETNLLASPNLRESLSELLIVRRSYSEVTGLRVH